MAWDHGLYLEVVGSKLHYYTDGIGEFIRLPSRPRGNISPVHMEVLINTIVTNFEVKFSFTMNDN